MGDSPWLSVAMCRGDALVCRYTEREKIMNASPETTAENTPGVLCDHCIEFATWITPDEAMCNEHWGF